MFSDLRFYSPENQRLSAEHWWLEDENSFWNGPFSGDIGSFPVGTWRIIPVSKWLVTPIYKPGEQPFLGDLLTIILTTDHL